MSEGYAEQVSMEEETRGSASGRGTASFGSEPLGHTPVIPPRIGLSPGLLGEKVLERYRTSAVPDISDAVGRLYTMDSGIRPLYRPIKRIVGVALTVKAPPGDNWAIHKALSLSGRDDVLIVDWRGYTEGCGTGVKTLTPAIRRGLAGVIVDGGWRDIGEIQALDFPVYGRAISAFSPAKRELGEINVPICCGGVIVEPGDVIVADGEGAVVVPGRHAEQVARTLPEPEEISADEHTLEDSIGRIAEAYQEAFEARGGLSQ